MTGALLLFLLLGIYQCVYMFLFGLLSPAAGIIKNINNNIISTIVTIILKYDPNLNKMIMKIVIINGTLKIIIFVKIIIKMNKLNIQN
ncbi:MAG: hypothetical protein GY755_23515 [Chloroflexi bacterium]|nr:hypothetical protein [Chloroflexota bacterium]